MSPVSSRSSTPSTSSSNDSQTSLPPSVSQMWGLSSKRLTQKPQDDWHITQDREQNQSVVMKNRQKRSGYAVNEGQLNGGQPTNHDPNEHCAQDTHLNHQHATQSDNIDMVAQPPHPDELLQHVKSLNMSSTDTKESSQPPSKDMIHYLLPSPFPNRPASVIFPNLSVYSKDSYDTIVDSFGPEIRKVVLHTVSKRKDRGLYFRMPPSAVEFNVIKNAFKRAGFKRTNKFEKFNMLWGKHMKFDDYSKLNEYQRVNHFPGTWALGRKDNLARNLSRMRRRHGPVVYDFFPQSYLLPAEKDILRQDMETSSSNTLYILKPKASSCGRGIRVIKSIDQIKRKDCLVQQYIANPYLINQTKWDLRIYVIATSFDPLVIYMFDDGLVRFATEKYNPKKLSNRFIHLTNYSVNKNSKKFDKNQDATEDMTGSKWSIKALKRYFAENNIDDTKLWRDVKDVLIKTMIAVESSVNSLSKRYITAKGQRCFEVFGFDILVDSHLKPWIIEVNVSPSLSSSSPMDKRIKGALITQTFHLVGCVPYDRKKHAKHEEVVKRERLLGLSHGSSSPSILHSLNASSNSNGSVYRRTLFDLKRQNSKHGIDYLTPEDFETILHFEEEYQRRGNFERIFPTKTTLERYGRLFESERYNNVLMSMWLNEKKSKRECLLTQPTRHAYASSGTSHLPGRSRVGTSSGDSVRSPKEKRSLSASASRYRRHNFTTF